MNKTNKKTQNKSISLKKNASMNNVNLPKIGSNIKNQNKPNNKINNIPNPENSTLSLLSQSTIKSKSISNITFEEKLKTKNNSQKINDIINNVNRNHNFNSPITSKDRKIDNIIIPKEKQNLNISSNNNNVTNNINNNMNKNINIRNKNFNNNINIRNYNSKPKYKFASPKGLNNIKIDLDSSPKIEKEQLAPRITKERLKEIQEKRKKRLLQEKKDFEIQQKMFEEMKENNSFKKKQEIIYSNKINSPIEMSHKKAQHILEEGGMIEAYKYLITHLCKNGLPTGSLYEYSSGIIKNYEKEWKKKKSKMLNEKIEKHFENQKKLYLNDENNLNKSKDNLIYKVLKRREEEQFIKKLDKSRSTLHIIKKKPEITTKLENNKEQKNKESEIKNTKINNIINNNIEKNNNENTEIKKLNKENNKLNIGNDIKNIKQSYNDKNVYFNIKLKKNNEEIKKNV